MVRLVKKQNADPSLAVLVPSVGEGEETLIIQQIPCSDDMREFAFPTLKASAREDPAAADRKRKAVGDFVNSITIAHDEVATRPSLISPINPSHFAVYEWSSSHFTGKTKSSTRAACLEGLPFENKTLQPESLERLQQLSEYFELKKVVKTSSKKKKYYFDDDDDGEADA